jgi:hypothetical protein
MSLIDFDNTDANVFHASWEWALKPPARKGKRAQRDHCQIAVLNDTVRASFDLLGDCHLAGDEIGRLGVCRQYSRP